MIIIPNLKYNGKRVLTTEKLAELYCVSPTIIINNLIKRGKHFINEDCYYLLYGEELTAFYKTVDFGVYNEGIQSALYLWTEKGALRQARAINFDEAWESYEILTDYYFHNIYEKSPIEIKGAVENNHTKP